MWDSYKQRFTCTVTDNVALHPKNNKTAQLESLKIRNILFEFKHPDKNILRTSCKRWADVKPKLSKKSLPRWLTIRKKLRHFSDTRSPNAIEI